MNISKIVRMLLLAGMTALIAHYFIREETPPVEAPPVETASDIFGYIREGDTTGFVHWIEQSPDLDQRNPEGHTPLIHAIVNNRLAYAIDLIGHGADKELTDHDGMTALHRAASSGYSPLVSLLIEAGANSQTMNRQGLTAYDLAVLQNHTNAVSILDEARVVIEIPDIPAGSTPAEPVEAEIPPAVLLSTDFRTWTGAGGETIEAAYIQNIFDTVILQQRDGKFFRIPLTRLISADQILVRQLSGLDPHALARARSSRSTPAAKSGSQNLSSKLKESNGWTVLEGCQLIKSGANDGDSFHVEHDGKEYIFRLYFVDAAETESTYPERVRDQADYFNLDREETLALGKAAARFTASLLAGQEFTVATRWEDAKGNSRLPRFYALVTTDQGDLDELLVEEGLVRRYGMSISGSVGQKKQTRLKQLEGKAKDEGNGAWGKGS